MISIKYSLKKDFPEWTNTKNINEDKTMQQLNLKQLIDKIILTIETIEDDEVVAFEIIGK